MQQGQRAVQSFRDRLLHWWQGKDHEQTNDNMDRNRELGGQNFGLGSSSSMQQRGI
jgi:hypothetical protein